MLKLSGNKPMKVPRTVLIGSECLDRSPEDKTCDSVVRLENERGGTLSFNDDMLSKGTLFIGPPGCGKTTVMSALLDQIIPSMTDNDIMLILDTKGDYIERYYNADDPRHILIDPTDVSGRAKSWNIFCELFDRDGNVSERSFLAAHEIAKCLFRNIESQNQPFFHLSAADIFKMILFCDLEDAIKSHDFSKINNAVLCDKLSNLSVDMLYKIAENHPRFGYIKGYLGDPGKATTQSLGVTGYLNAMINTQFVGSFRIQSSAGQFSIKRLIREKGRKLVFIKYDIAFGEMLAPVYSLLYDMAIKEALSVGGGNTYLICDEMHLLPYCGTFGSATNYGRSRGVKLLAGFQNINQLYDNYGESEAKNIAAAFANVLCFGATDADTRDYIAKRFGETFELVSFAGENISHQGFSVYDSDIRTLRNGECFVDIPDAPPFKFKLKLH